MIRSIYYAPSALPVQTSLPVNSLTTLFMPITFITGFFGMNFFESRGSLLEWTTRPVFTPIALIMLFFPFGMYLWMRRRAWI